MKVYWFENKQCIYSIETGRNINLIAWCSTCKINVATYGAHPIRRYRYAFMIMTWFHRSLLTKRSTRTSSWLTTARKYSSRLQPNACKKKIQLWWNLTCTIKNSSRKARVININVIIKVPIFKEKLSTIHKKTVISKFVHHCSCSSLIHNTFLNVSFLKANYIISEGTR